MNESMSAAVRPADLAFFATLAASSSLTSAAQKLGRTPAAVSKRLIGVERRAGVVLIDRTTRRMMLTAEGEILLERARRILGDIDGLGDLLGSSKATPKGNLRVHATLGFGRKYIGPLVSRFVVLYPQVSVQLHLSPTPLAPGDDAYDVGVFFGEPPDAHVVARRLASNRRLLCAAPSYLARRGTPGAPRELLHHACIDIRQGGDAYGVWRLSRTQGGHQEDEIVHIGGNLATNDGETAVKWALDGHGILMRAEWDINEFLANGRLVVVLPDYQTRSADIYAVYARHLQASARVRAFVDFMTSELRGIGRPS